MVTPSDETTPPRLADESRWYTEHTALVLSTLKGSLLGAAAGICVGGATRAFLWSLAASSWVGGHGASPERRGRGRRRPPRPHGK